MSGLHRRLQALEERHGVDPAEHERVINREILRRMSTPDLHCLETLVGRAEEGSLGELEDLSVEDSAMLKRYEELCRQVREEYEGGESWGA